MQSPTHSLFDDSSRQRERDDFIAFFHNRFGRYPRLAQFSPTYADSYFREMASTLAERDRAVASQEGGEGLQPGLVGGDLTAGAPNSQSDSSGARPLTLADLQACLRQQSEGLETKWRQQTEELARRAEMLERRLADLEDGHAGALSDEELREQECRQQYEEELALLAARYGYTDNPGAQGGGGPAIEITSPTTEASHSGASGGRPADDDAEGWARLAPPFRHPTPATNFYTRRPSVEASYARDLEAAEHRQRAQSTPPGAGRPSATVSALQSTANDSSNGTGRTPPPRDFTTHPGMGYARGEYQRDSCLPTPGARSTRASSQAQFLSRYRREDTPASTRSSVFGEKRPHVKPDVLGTYDGTPADLGAFISRVESLIQHNRGMPGCETAVLDALPACFRTAASKWFENMPDSLCTRLVTWSAWRDAMRRTFGPDIRTLCRAASDRMWDWENEPISTYYHDKLALLRRAHPARPEVDHVFDIVDRVPASFMCILRLDWKNEPSLEHLYDKLKNNENPWRLSVSNASRTESQDPGLRNILQPRAERATISRKPTVAVATGHSPQSSVDSFLSVSTSATAPPRGGLAASYSPDNVGSTMRNGKKLRTYKAPHSGKLFVLDRSCGKCGGKHFDFEHHWLEAHKASSHSMAMAKEADAAAYRLTTLDLDANEKSWESEADTSSASQSTTSSQSQGGA